MRVGDFDFTKRLKIEQLANKQFCYAGIARQIGCPVLAVYREIKQGGGKKNYSAERAEEIDRIAKERMGKMQQASQEKLLKELKQRATLPRSTYVEEQLKELHDQLADVTKKLGSLHEYITQREASREAFRENKANPMHH